MPPLVVPPLRSFSPPPPREAERVVFYIYFPRARCASALMLAARPDKLYFVRSCLVLFSSFDERLCVFGCVVLYLFSHRCWCVPFGVLLWLLRSPLFRVMKSRLC